MSAFWTLDPEVTFLNHGSFGACPVPVQQAQQRWRERLESEPIRLLMREFEGELDRARARLGGFLHAQPRDLVFVPNATTAVNTVLRSLLLSPGDELLITRHGYNACNNAVRFVAQQQQARVVVAEVPFPLKSSAQVLETVLAAVTPRTRFALLDHVTSPTGVVFPVAELCRELSARGVRVMIDGAHAPGMVELDVPKVKADWYTGNLHKWCCAPKGAAFLWTRAELQQSLRPLVVSHGANAQRTDRSRLHLEFDWTGTFDPSPWLCVPDALDAIASLRPGGWPEVMEQNRALALSARTLLAQTLGCALPAPDEMIGSLATLPLGGELKLPGFPGSGALDPLQDLLWDKHRIEVPVLSFSGSRYLRISAAPYNTLADYEKLAAVLRQHF